ncbi:unnamed protein product [Cochlearia groenlandica]
MRTSLAFYCSLIIFILLLSKPLPTSSEIQEIKAQTMTFWVRRRLSQKGDSTPSDHRDSLRVFIRKSRVVGGRVKSRKSRHHVPSGGGSVGSSATTRLCLSKTFNFGSTVASFMLLMYFAF